MTGTLVRNKRSSIRSSRSTSWSSSSTSSSSSRSSSSSSSDCKTTRLKSVVILVKKSPNYNEYTSKSRYDDQENERRRFTNNHPGYVNPKVRMICTPPLPSLETTNNQQEYPYYYNNNNYYHSYPEPVPLPSVPSNVSYPYLAQYPTRNQFRPISPVKEISQIINQPNSPLNQYQEVSSTINQNDACSNQNNDSSKPSETISEADDLFSFKSKLQEQLKLKLFDSNTLKVSNSDNINKSISNSINNSSSTLSLSSASNLVNELNQPKRKKSKKEHKKKRDKKRHRTSTKPHALTNKEDYSDNEDTNLRRSSRIKTIETIRQHHKVMKIAEKVKNHNDNNQTEMIKNETQDNASTENLPIKVKDRWRRYSEIDLYDSLSPQSSNIQATEENSLTLANLMIKPNIINSPSSSSLTNSPRAYKKLLLDKAVNELGINHSPNTNNNNNNDEINIKKIPPLSLKN